MWWSRGRWSSRFRLGLVLTLKVSWYEDGVVVYGCMTSLLSCSHVLLLIQPLPVHGLSSVGENVSHIFSQLLLSLINLVLVNITTQHLDQMEMFQRLCPLFVSLSSWC